MMERVNIAGAPIDVINVKDAAELVLRRFKNGLRTRVAPVNAAVVNLASKNKEFQATLQEFDLVLADGFWPALSATCLFRQKVPHANTLPFVKTLFQNWSPDSLKVFLLGAKPDVVKKAARNLQKLYPEVKVVGYRDGYFESHEEINVVNLINESRAKILLVGISSPKKELFIQRHWAGLNVALSIGVGGLFDILAGEIQEAPDWIRKYGFEWIFRFVQEPKRFWKRYTITNIRFIWLVILQAFYMVFHISQ